MKRFIKLLSILLLVLAVKAGMGQHLSIYNLYTQNRFLYNPAHAGDFGQAFLNFRNEWSGIEQSPETYTFGIHSPIGKEKKSGLGMLLARSTYGTFEDIRGSLNYSYTVAFNEFHHLSFGLSAGIVDDGLNKDALRAPEEDLAELYTVASDYYDGILRFDAGFGMNYTWKDKLRLGISLPRLIANTDYPLDRLDGTREFNQHFIGMISYKLSVADEKLDIEPSVLYRTNAYGTNQFDLNLFVQWNQTLWIAATYRDNPGTDFVFAAGVNISNIGIGYAYQKEVSGAAHVFPNATHEIQISYFIGRDKEKKGDEDLLNDNQIELIDSLKAAKADEEYQKQIDSLKKEIETLKLLMQVKDIKDWVEGFQDKIDKMENDMYETMKKKKGDDIVAPVYFDTDKYDIKPSEESKLKELAEIMKRDKIKIEIVGHADDRGTYEYNQTLSEQRANATFKYLVKLGCPENSFIMVGRGETEPAQKGQDEKARQMNRRAQFRLTDF
jgi:type IX secretion system PorP/SprF family membrane protein